MPNVFVDLPLPVLNGPGAAVATGAMGWDKTLVFAGDTNGATVTVEASVDGGVVFQPVEVFQGGNYKKVIGVAAQFMRVNVTNRNPLLSFSANIDVGANDNGAQFAALPLPAGNGAGAPVDVSVFGRMRTFIVGGSFPKAVVEIQASEDGIDWAPCLSFAGRGDIENKPQTSRFYRTFVRNRGSVFGATVAIGAANDSISAASAGNDVTSQWTALVDPAFGNDATGVVGNLSQPFATIQGALNAIPAPVDAASARRVFSIIVSPGTYDENLAVDLTGGKKIKLVSWGQWNLGLFNAPNWQPSNERSIVITTANAVVFDFIDPSFSIEPMLPTSMSDDTDAAQVAVPRISGNIDTSGVFVGTPNLQLSVQAEIFGTVASAASIVGGATNVILRAHRSRMRRAVTGAGIILQDATESRFQALVNISSYGRIEECSLQAGMTVVGPPSSNTTPGIYDSQLTGVFTGPAGSYWLDLVSSFWFRVNGCAFGGAASRTVVEIMHPMALPEQWAVQNVAANVLVATPMSAQVSTNFDNIPAIRVGSIVGMSARLTDALVAGTIEVEITINGAGVGPTGRISLGAPTSGDFLIIPQGDIPYVQGDLIGVQYTSTADLDPVTSDLEVWLEVVEEVP